MEFLEKQADVLAALLLAYQLFRATIDDWLPLVIFAVSLLALYRVKSKYTVVFVTIGSGIVGMLYHQIMQP